MSKSKSFIVKTVFLLLIVVALLVMAGFIIARQASGSITGTLSTSVAFNAKSAATTVGDVMGRNLTAAQSESGFDAKTYSARGIYDKESKKLSVNFAAQADAPAQFIEGGLLPGWDWDQLSNKKFETVTLSKIFLPGTEIGEELKVKADTPYFLYVYPTIDTASKKEICRLLFQTETQFLSQIAIYSDGSSTFKHFVMAKGTTVVFSDFENMNAGDRLGDFGAEFDEQISNSPLDAKSFLTSSLGDYYVGLYRIESITSPSARYYFYGFTDMATVQETIDYYVMNVIVILGFCSLVIAVLCVVYGVLTLRAHKLPVGFANALHVETEELYPLTVNADGGVTESTSDYDRHYAVRDLSAQVVYGSFRKDFRVGDTFLCALKDHKNEKHLLNFSVVKAIGAAKERTGYKVIAADVTDLSETLAQAMAIDIKQENPDAMKDTYDKLILTRKRCLIGRIHLTNLPNLQVMFGKKFSDKVFNALVDRAAKRFDAVFPRRVDDSVGIIVSESADFGMRCDSLNEDMNELNHPVSVEENLVNVGCEGGFALVERGIGDTTFKYVDRCVRAAMKRAAADDHREFYVYHDFQKKHFVRYMDTEYDIKKMLAEDSFEMQFQPQYSVASKRVAGFEALFRFKKTLNLDIDTFSFIEYAERTGNMIALGNFIFDTSMKFAKQLEGKDVTVSLNVSPVQLMQVGFVENLLRIYREYKLQPGSICVEITESFFMTTMDETLMKLELLIQEGITVHLDDFGTRYSSLLYLKKLPISAIKIDMEFVRDVCTDPYSQAITQMVVNIGRQLGAEIIAEGVETKEQKELLSKMGCDYLQGYLIGKSMPAKEALALV